MILKEELYMDDKYLDNNYSENREPQKKKRGFFFRFTKFTALAITFGLIAGIGASGYHYIANRPKDNKNVELESDLESEQMQLAEDALIELSSDDEATAVKTEGIITDVSDVIDKVMPSIVSINSTDITTQYDIFFGREFNKPTVGSGSGIIIGQNDSDILIVTNNHVIENAQHVEVVFVDESKVKATIKGTDSRSDLAILEVSLEDLPKDTLKEIKVARLGNSESLKAGEMVIAIGNALGYGQSSTVGYVSALDREIEIQGITMNLLQTDAAINPGNSGGALLNIYGEVIGINSVKLASNLVEGMGYAIPISDAIPMINLLVNNKAQEVTEMGFLGINAETAQNVTKDLLTQFNLPMGVYINDIVEGSPADEAGIKSGHVITGFNDIKIETMDNLLNILSYSRPGEEVTIKINELQDGKYVEKDVKVILGERP